MRAFRVLALLIILAVSGVAGCAANPLRPVVDDKPFVDWYMHMADQVKANPDYHKIPLDTDQKAQEFVGWLHAMYRNQITPAQFEQQVDTRYPGHGYEARFIVGTLPPADARPPQPVKVADKST